MKLPILQLPRVAIALIIVSLIAALRADEPVESPAKENQSSEVSSTDSCAGRSDRARRASQDRLAGAGLAGGS